MVYTFTIHSRLAGMNDFINAQRKNKYAGAEFKCSQQEIVAHEIRRQLHGVKIRRPVRISYIWIERDKRRDLDNVSGFGHKVVQDALVQCKVLKNDGWAEIVGYRDYFEVDKERPRVVVSIEEVE